MEILHLHKYSDPLLSTLYSELLASIKALSLLGMKLQAWHTCIWGVYPILFCRSSPALSGWMGRVAAQVFSGLSRHVHSGSSLGSDWATEGHSETFTLLWSWFSSRISLHFAPFIFPSTMTSLPVPATEKLPHFPRSPPLVQAPIFFTIK